MAKRYKVVKASHAISHEGQGQLYEHRESIDDSLLPDAVELRKLKAIDPEGVSWIKEQTAREQDARHSFMDRRMGLWEKGQRRTYALDMLTLLCALMVILCGMTFSCFLIYYQQSVIGTVFAGGTLIFAATAFLNYRKKSGQRSEVIEH